MENEIRNIVETLNELQCPFSGDGKDKWIREILFKPSFERYNLMQWILEQLGIDISELFECENSVESKIQNLTHAFSCIGVCSDDESDIIEGTASMKKQLTFWNFLCSMMSKRNELHGLSCDSTNFNDSDYERNLSKQYESSMEYVNKVCGSVNLIDSFDRELKLFPSQLLKEASNALKKSGGSPTYEELKKNYREKFGDSKVDPDINNFIDVQKKNFDFKETENNDIPEEAALNEIEVSIAESLRILENLASTFDDVHINLKPFLDVKPKESDDTGPAFKAADEKLKALLKLKDSATLLRSSDLELEDLTSEVSNLHISSGCLSGEELNEYLGILSRTEEKE